MKFIYIFSILTLLSLLSYSQNDTIIYQTKDTVIWKGFVLSGPRIGTWWTLENKYHSKEIFSFVDSNTLKVTAIDSIHNYSTIDIYSKTDSNTLILDGLSEDYYGINANKYLSKKCYYKNGCLDGPYLYFNNTGRLLKLESYTKNQLNGLWITYYPNSNIMEIGNFYKGLKIGIWKEYYENGALKSKGEYYDNLINVYLKNMDTISISLKDTLMNIPYYDSFLKESSDYYSIYIKYKDPTICYLSFAIVSYPITIYPKDKIWLFYDEHGKLVSKRNYEAVKNIKKILRNPGKGLSNALNNKF